MLDALGAPSVWPSLLEQPAWGAPGLAEPAPGVAGACALTPGYFLNPGLEPTFPGAPTLQVAK